MKGSDASSEPGGDTIGSYYSPVHSLLGLSVTYFLLFLAQSLWRATLHTNAVKNFGLDGSDVGFLFSLTYLPGVFCFLIGLAATRVQLYRLVTISCALLSTGMLCASLSSGFFGIAVATVLVALGFTVFYTTSNAICLISGQPTAVAVALGRLKSLGPLSGLAAAIIIIAVFAPDLAVRAGVAMRAASSLQDVQAVLALFSAKPELDVERMNTLLVCVALTLLLAGAVYGRLSAAGMVAGGYGRLQLRRLLIPYYALNFLAGCRSAIFQAFALFVMIAEFRLPIHATAVLVFAGNFCSFLGYRGIGHSLGRFRHRSVLYVIYVVVMCNFVGFWYVLSWSGFDSQQRLIALCTLFLVDSLLFGVSVVTDSYLRTTGKFSSYVGDIGSGMTFFSIAAVSMSLLGGALWNSLGHNTFLLGAAVCLLAMIVGRTLPRSAPVTPGM